jgi:hypothetical protein
VRGQGSLPQDGSPILPPAQIRAQYREQVDFKALGTYAAAMELVTADGR